MSKTISFKCDDSLYEQLKNQTNNTSKFIKEAIEEKLSITKPKEESEIQKLWQEINNIKAEINGNTFGITSNTKVIPNKERGNTESKLSANQLRALEVVNSIDQSLEVMTSKDKKAVLSSRYPKNEFRKRMKEVVSKDSVSKYWEKIEQGLKG